MTFQGLSVDWWGILCAFEFLGWFLCANILYLYALFNLYGTD